MADPPRTVVPAALPPSGAASQARPWSRRDMLVAGTGILTAVVLAPLGAAVPTLPELAERCCFGAYADNEPYPVDAHFALERRIGGTRLPVCSWFVQFGSSFPAEAATVVAGRGGYDLLLAWEAHGIAFDDILAGSHDEYIWRFVRDAGEFPGAVVLRPFHESNGDWYDWSPASGRGYVRDADQWIAAWRHVVTIGRRAGRPNVRFAWCMSSHDTTGALERLWPGEDVVDILGIDAYGWTVGSRFETLLDDVYERVAGRHPRAPVWVCELGLGDQQTGAADFYRSVYGATRYPRLAVVCWFDKDQFTITADPAATTVHAQQLPRAPRSVSWVG